MRERLAQFSDPELAATRQQWWHDLAEHAEDLANGYEPVAVAPLSFVANSMVGNRLQVAEGVSELSDKVREQIRAELSVVLLAVLLQAWSAEGGSGLPTPSVVRPVAELADDLIEQLFGLGRPVPPEAVKPKPEPVRVTPAAPRGHITAIGGDVLGALLAGTGGSAPSGPPASSISSPVPIKVDTTAQADEPTETPSSSISATPGLVSPIKPPSDDDRDEAPDTSPLGIPVTDALALLAPDLSAPDKVTDPTHRWDTVGPIAKRRKDEG